MLAEKNTRTEYLKKHKVDSLFARLATALAIHRPANPLEYLIDCLEKNEIDDFFETPTVKGIKL